MRNILEYLERSAKRCPQKTAVTEREKSMTYAQWQESSKRIGTALCGLRDHEGKPIPMYREKGKPIPVYMEKGILALQCFFGIVYSGNFYVFLNPELPVTRLREIVKILEAEVLLTDQEHLEKAKELLTDQEHFEGAKELLANQEYLEVAGKPGCAGVFLAERLLETPVNEEELNRVREQAVDTDPLYANFTSGSTGVPKGVLVGHRSVIDFIDNFVELFHMRETDVIGNQAPFDFDVSVKDIYSSVSAGATLVVIPRELFSQPAALLDMICEKRITTMIWAVSALCLISTFHGLDYRTPDCVKKILFSGEVMPKKHLKLWQERLPEAEFVNLYGPTEITCNCTYHRIDRNRAYEEKIPIGIPFPNEKVFLLDDQDDMVTEPGQVGEICVGGTALAIGYYRNQEQTEKHFVQNPLNKNCYERIYRSGDLGCYNERGELYFCGRRDFQIKHMGHRIELEEIEAMFMKQEGVERVCCVFDEKKSRLYAAYLGKAREQELLKQVSDVLPVFMIPRKLVRMETLPISKNGKIDRGEVLRLVTKKWSRGKESGEGSKVRSEEGSKVASDVESEEASKKGRKETR